MTTEPSPVRCSDTEREQTALRLQHAAAEGRLSLEEVEERLTGAYGARHRHDLAALTADLPAAPVRTGWGAILGQARAQVRDDVAGLLGRDGTKMSPRRRIAIVVAVLILLMVLASAAMLALHGFAAGWQEHHMFDHRPGPPFSG